MSLSSQVDNLLTPTARRWMFNAPACYGPGSNTIYIVPERWQNRRFLPGFLASALTWLPTIATCRFISGSADQTLAAFVITAILAGTAGCTLHHRHPENTLILAWAHEYGHHLVARCFGPPYLFVFRSTVLYFVNDLITLTAQPLPTIISLRYWIRASQGLQHVLPNPKRQHRPHPQQDYESGHNIHASAVKQPDNPQQGNNSHTQPQAHKNNAPPSELKALPSPAEHGEGKKGKPSQQQKRPLNRRQDRQHKARTPPDHHNHLQTAAPPKTPSMPAHTRFKPPTPEQPRLGCHKQNHQEG